MWEIWAYQDADALAGIFNAISAVVGSQDYLSAIGLVAFVGFVVAFVAYVFAPERLIGWKWLGTVVFVYSILFLPRDSVQIIDRTSTNPPQVIGNVPLGVAVFGGITSQIGYVLTNLFETAFQTLPGPGSLPAELSYQRNGIMFGARLVKYTRNLTFLSPQFRTDLIAYIDNCVKYDLLDGTIDPQLFSQSDDVWSLMGNTNPARLTPITTAPGNSTVVPCNTAYPILNAEATAQAGLMQSRLGQQLNPTLTAAAASAAIGTQLEAAYAKNALATAGRNAAQLILQNAMINAINDTSGIVGQRTSDPASLLLSMGRAQAVAQTNASWMNFGKVAEDALPLIRNTIEAIVYALFPIMLLVLFLTSGAQTIMALKSYAMTLMWVQLWPPVYAILNYMASLAAADKLAAAANVGGGATAMSLSTASSVYSTAISAEAVVGYLVMSVPAIAWAALKGMHSIGQAAFTGTSSLQSTVGAATSGAASGNMSLGNISMDQMALAPNRSSAFMATWQDDRTGNTFRTNAFGREAVDMLSNNGFASRIVSHKVSSNDVKEASKAVEAAQADVVSAQRERAATLTSLLSKGVSALSSTRTSDGSSSGGSEEWGQSVQDLSKITSSRGRELGVGENQVANVGFRLALSAAGKTGGKKENGGGLTLKGSNGNLGKDYLAQFSEGDRKIAQNLSSADVGAFSRFADRSSRDHSFVSLIASDSSQSEGLSAQLATRTAQAQRAEAALNERVSFAQRVSEANERGESISIDMARDPYFADMMMMYANDYGHNPQSAQVMMDAELARNALGPTPTFGAGRFADGSAVPQGLGDVRALNAGHRHAPQFNPAIDGQNAADRGTVRGKGPALAAGASPGTAPAPGSAAEKFRQGVSTASDAVRNVAKHDVGRYEADHGVVRDADGRASTSDSQVKSLVRQVDRDAVHTYENVKGWAKETFGIGGKEKK